MTKARYGVLAGIAGAAIMAWWWRHYAGAVARDVSEAGHERGETIFSNSPAVNP